MIQQQKQQTYQWVLTWCSRYTPSGVLYAGLDNNGEYDCINRADEEREKRNSFVDFKTIISCYNEVYGYLGLMCGEDCLPYHEWCRQGTSQSCNSIFTTCVANSTWCRQDNSRITTNNTNLCRNNFWSGHDCLQLKSRPIGTKNH